MNNCRKRYRDSGKGQETLLSWRLKNKYNISIEDYNALLDKQKHCCAICNRNKPTGKNWHIDHCHTTGKVRGLLCSKCNQGLGLFDDKQENLMKAIQYIKAFKEQYEDF